MRRIAALMLACGLALVPAAALAHTELVSSEPADGATVTDAPTEVVLTFEGEIDEGASFTVTDPFGEVVGDGEVDLEVADRNVMRGDVAVSEPGEYLVAWSVVGEDGHPVEGEIAFTYDPEGEATPPDTALPVNGGPMVALAGAALLLLAAALAVARRTLPVLR